MTVPKATVDEDSKPILRENKVRLPRKLRVVEPITEPLTVNLAPKIQLWIGIS